MQKCKNTQAAFLFGCLWLSFPLTAFSQDFWGRTVKSIHYQPSQQPADQHDLDDAQIVKVGSPLEQLQVAATIDRLFYSGLYADVKVNAEPDGDGVTLTFVTVAKQFVGHIDARGKIKDPPNRAVIIGDSEIATRSTV